MLPRRNIVQALPQAGLRVQTSTMASRSIRSTVGHGRQFGTARRGLAASLAASSGLRVKVAAPALTASAFPSSRALSLWGYGSSKNPPTPSESTSSPDASKFVEPPSEPATAMPSLSTSTAPGAPPAVSPAADLTTTAPADNDLSHISDLISQHDNILSRPETIGYLKEMGLDYGWGPTSVVQWVLEHIHVYTGLGWGASIAAAAVLIRVVFFWPQVLNMRNAAKMQKMRQDSRHTQAMEMMQEGRREHSVEKINKGRFVQNKLSKEYGASMKASLWGLLPIPFTYGMFRVVTGMGNLPVPSFEHAGFLWFTDLSAVDPYYVLPFASVGMMVAGMKVMQKQTPPDQLKLMNTMMIGMGGIMSIVGLWFAAGVHVMGISFGAATLVQALILSNNTMRRVLDIPTVTPQTKAVPPAEATYEPPRSLVEKMTQLGKDGQKSMEGLTANFTGRAPESDEDKAIRARKERLAKIEKSRMEQEQEEFNRKYKR